MTKIDGKIDGQKFQIDGNRNLNNSIQTDGKIGHIPVNTNVYKESLSLSFDCNVFLG